MPLPHIQGHASPLRITHIQVFKMAQSGRKHLAMAGILLILIKTSLEKMLDNIEASGLKKFYKKFIFSIEENLLIYLLNKAGEVTEIF